MDSKDLPSFTLDDITIDLGDSGGAGTYNITSSSGTDTITLDPIWSTMGSTITIPSTTLSTGSGGSGINYTTSSTSYNWAPSPATVNITSNGIDMAAGTDIKVDGKSLKEFMSKMEQRLSILVPDPAKLEKFEALKKAYEHYKTMESLCFDEPKEEDK
jgi:hypothetical protein